MPKIYNLRSDPFERATEDATMFYDKWMADRAFLLVPAQAIVGEFLKTFEEFPPRQKPASFSIDQALEKARQSAGGDGDERRRGREVALIAGRTTHGSLAQSAVALTRARWTPLRIRCASSTPLTRIRLPSRISIARVTSGRTPIAIAPTTICAGPARPYRADLDILVAGCGTWQAAKYALCRPQAQVVGIDVSTTSLEHTEQLKRKYDLTNLETHAAVDRELSASMQRRFDLIVCTGVLHHLLDPDAGLRALRSVLKPDGAIYLMVYAPYGRTGIYMLQEYCRTLGVGRSDVRHRRSSRRGCRTAAAASVACRTRHVTRRAEHSCAG